MSDQDVQVRSVTHTERDGVFELAAGFVGGTARVGLTVASVPLVLLPKRSRRRVRRAMAELARAIVALPKELADVSVRVVDEIYEGGDTTTPNLPRIDNITARARNFTDRLARATEEFTSSVGRAGQRAGDSVERAAARVDEWVEKS